MNRSSLARARGRLQALAAHIRYPLGLRRWSRRVLRLFGYTAAAVLALLAVAFTVARLWLPTLAEKNLEITAYLSERSGHRVEIERLEAYWEGLNPGLRAFQLEVYSPRTGQPAVHLAELRLTLAWLPLLIGRTEINNLVLVRPSLTFERLKDGRFTVSGLDPPAVESGGEREEFVNWLFAQRRIAVEQGELLWLDHRGAEPALRLSGMDLTLRNDGRRHRLGARAEFPATLCRSCSLVVDIAGNPLAGESWDGRVNLRALGLRPQGLPAVLRGLLPEGLAGEFSARLRSEWRDGEPRAVQGRIGVVRLNLPLPGLSRALRLNEAEAELRWSGERSRWALDLRDLRLGFAGPAWSAGRLRLDHDPSRSVLRIGRVDLADIAAFIQELPPQGPVTEWVSGLRPAGDLEDIELRLAHEDSQPSRYALELGVKDLQVLPFRFVPGLSGVSGHLTLAPEEGEFRIEADAGGFTLPRVFRETLPWKKASGRLRWRREPEHWRLRAQNLRAVTEDGTLSGRLELHLPHAEGASPRLDLSAQLHDGNGAHAARYYPSALPAAARTWLERSVRAGHVTRAQVAVNGALEDFPFRGGNGRFEVTAHMRDGVLEYLPGWPRLERVEADLLLRGTEILITGGAGRIGRLAANQLTIRIEDLERDPRVDVSGRLEGGVGEALEALSGIPPSPGQAAALMAGWRGEGRGRLALDLSIPLDAPERFRLDGEYRLRQAALHLPVAGISLQALEGVVGFDGAGPTAASLEGRFLGGPFRLQGETGGAPPEFRLKADGHYSGEGLTRALHPSLRSYMDGEGEWRAELRLRAGVPWLRFESDLQRLGLRLPAPFDKPRDAPARLEVHTVSASTADHVLDLAFDRRAAGKLAFHRGARGWTLDRGRLAVGIAPVTLPPEAGLHLELRTPALDADPWLRLFKELSAGTGETGSAGWVTRLNAEVGRFKLFNTSFGLLRLTLGRGQDGWLGQVHGDALGGNIRYNPQGPGSLQLDLDHLSLPDELWQGPAVEIDPRRLPQLHLRSAGLALLGRSLGELQLDLLPTTQGLKIEQLRITRPETTLLASGLWRVGVGGKAATTIEVQLSSSDFGTTLAAFGFPDELAGGRGELRANWSWSGTPLEFDPVRLDGSLGINVTNGRLLQVQQGAGRVFGVIDLRSLVRYLTLDFSPVFGEGFVFDSIKGDVTVEKGNARAGRVVIKGPSATVLVTGRIGLAARDFDLEIGVLPRIKEELMLTGWFLANPAVGAAVLALQELFRKPLTDIRLVRFVVKGPWSDPEVTRPARPPSGEAVPPEPLS